MTSAVDAPHVVPAVGPPRTKRRLLVAFAVTAVFAALAGLTWWWSHPSKLPDSGPTVGMYTGLARTRTPASWVR